jgi:putative flippase GtrA
MKTPEKLIAVYHKLLSYSFARFVIIGGLGFVANYLMLIILFDKLGIRILWAQLIGAEVALLTTFCGNNYWAFRDHHHIPLGHKLVKYHVTSGLGIAITSTMVIVLVDTFHLYYLVSLALAASVGMVWNFAFNSIVIFKKKASTA